MAHVGAAVAGGDGGAGRLRDRAAAGALDVVAARGPAGGAHLRRGPAGRAGAARLGRRARRLRASAVPVALSAGAELVTVQGPSGRAASADLGWLPAPAATCCRTCR